MPETNRIEALIHLDFLLMNRLTSRDPFIHHPEEVELRERWDAVAVSVSKDPASRLVYVTWLSENELKAGEAGLSNPWRDMDYDRIETYRWMLGRRMTVVSMTALYSPSIKEEVLQGDPLSPEARLYRQGQWTRACVEGEGSLLGDLLAIKNDKEHRILVPANSGSRVKGYQLLDWHKTLNRGV